MSNETNRRALPLASAPQDEPAECTAWSAGETLAPAGQLPAWLQGEHARPAPLALPAEVREADILIVNTSAGKDSQAMMSALVRAVATLPQGERPRLVAVHCDLGRVEWNGTAELAERQAEYFGMELRIVARQRRARTLGSDLLAHVAKRGMWPSPAQRYCTSDHKTSIVHSLMTALAAELRAKREAASLPARAIRIVSALGLRSAESSGRDKRLTTLVAKRADGAALELEKKPTGKGTAKRVHRWYPIHDWSAAQVGAEVRHSGQLKAGLVHYAYTQHGMPRLSCSFCIMAPRSALIRAGHARPELLAEYVALEARIGHTFKRDESIASIAEAVAAGERPETIRTWEA